ncbi:hypothetical protein DBV15_03210 [Temnothorax longispinosus]|uniref:Uncharacterized protein n=1 Tax=Temnothorax longispinosus TaxID=300112 RepID=A0A4S2L3I9_9HYME|nr:hypothetical protein DBV15_03210 [Temnothorax longispinosus]
MLIRGDRTPSSRRTRARYFPRADPSEVPEGKKSRSLRTIAENTRTSSEKAEGRAHGPLYSSLLTTLVWLRAIVARHARIGVDALARPGWGSGTPTAAARGTAYPARVAFRNRSGRSGTSSQRVSGRKGRHLGRAFNHSRSESYRCDVTQRSLAIANSRKRTNRRRTGISCAVANDVLGPLENSVSVVVVKI